ncbi:MAG: deoxyguanosinetriphosphate triphosphohydrolase, partial [Arcanobacterium sp.]|nr:deoxyguanosinetriphosphate triphosphohydrolase [Arcanobacterium sp.]
LNELAAGFGGFEGNAQTLRVLTRLEAKRFHNDGRPAGLNLTRASLDATIKYPWPRFGGPQGASTPKFGVYNDDLPVFSWAHGNHGENRCIEAQIMDLSDDIAYCVHDVEDSVVHTVMYPARKASLATMDFSSDSNRSAVIHSTQAWYGTSITSDELSAALDRLLTVESWPQGFDGSMRSLARLKDLTSDLIGRFISSVTRATVEKEGEVGHIRYEANVQVPRDTLAEITILKGLAVHFVMAPREHEPDFFEQRSIIFDLMDALADEPEQRLEPMFLQLWRDADAAGKDRVFVDQIASLTDQSARMLHARYCGMIRH